jgi:hypothetical protein
VSEHPCPEEIAKATERMIFRGRQHVLYVLWNHISPDPRSFGDDPASRLISDSESERLQLVASATPPVSIDAATVLRAPDRLEKFRLTINESQGEIIAKATAALRAMDLEPPEAFVAWHPYSQAELTAELTQLTKLITRH